MLSSGTESLGNKLIALGEISALMSVQMPREKILALFSSKLHSLFGAQALAIWTYDPAEDMVILEYGHDLSAAVNSCCVQPVPARMFPEVKLAVDSGNAWVTEDLLDDPLFSDPETQKLLQGMSARAVMSVPLRALTNTFGALSLYFGEPRVFTTEERALALGFANALALSLNNIEAYERLVVSERVKSEVISIVAHQFRTPIATLRGNVELLKDESIGGNAGTRAQIVAELTKVGEKLRGYVEGFLNVKAIDEHRLEPKPEDVNAGDLVKKVTGDLEVYRQQHRIQLDLELPQNPLVIHVDPALVGDALLNIIGNAVKYTKTRVRVALRLESQEAVIAVEDDGLGIPAAEQPHIFQKLYRASNVARHPEASSGLGLYIAKQYVEKNGGRLWFTSTEGHGSTFFLAFPARPPA